MAAVWACTREGLENPPVVGPLHLGGLLLVGAAVAVAALLTLDTAHTSIWLAGSVD